MTSNISVKQLGTVLIAAVVVILAVWYMALFKPQTHQLGAARKADVQAKGQISGLQQQVSQLQGWEKQIPADKVKLAHYQQAIPSSPNLSAAIRSIQDAATTAGVSMTALAPVVPAAGQATTAAGPGGVPGAKAIPVTIAATGNYDGLTAFVRALNAMPRTLVIQSMTLGGTGNTMTTSIASTIYYTAS